MSGTNILARKVGWFLRAQAVILRDMKDSPMPLFIHLPHVLELCPIRLAIPGLEPFLLEPIAPVHPIPPPAWPDAVPIWFRGTLI